MAELLSQTAHERDQARSALADSRQVLEQKIRIEQEIADANLHMNQVMDSTFEGVMKIGPDWSILYGNRRAMEISPELKIGEDMWVCFPGLKGNIAEVNLRKTMEERLRTEYEIYFEPYEIWFRVSVYPTPTGISLFYRDFTDARRLEAQLAEQKEQAASEIAGALDRMNHIMDSTSEGIFKLSSDWVILYANRIAFAIAPDMVVGRSYWECFPAVDPETEGYLRQTMTQRVEHEWENYYAPYEAFYCVHTYPAENGMSVFFIPVTKRKKLEQQLELERTLREKRIEALSHMAGGLAHEISNPLAIIQGTASDLQRLADAGETLAAAEVRKASETIVNTSDRAIRILRGLRGFAREAGNDPMEYASIYDIVEEAAQIQEARFERHTVELRLSLPGELPPVLCRETQIGQIITNLVNNAFDAITQQDCLERWVEIHAESHPDELQIDVVDSGPGIDETARQHLMEPFFTTKTRGLGMGVGLSLSRAIANEHGGTLELCAGTLHTTFRLLLPLGAADQEGTETFSLGADHAVM